jgi:hypothetical protein
MFSVCHSCVRLQQELNGAMQLCHSRNPSVKISVKTEGFLEKRKSIVVVAARDLSAGDVLSVDMAPGKLESQA